MIATAPVAAATPASASLPVVETFHSLQGEGLHAGRSAFFIRLAGCTVGCSWCDTKHSWPEAAHPRRPLSALAAEAQAAAAAGAAFVVITGGEPLHHDLDPLCTALRAIPSEPEQAIPGEPASDNGAKADSGLPAGQAQQTGLSLPLPLHLETSGVDPLSGRFDWITLSPKRHRPPREELLAACQELKVVVHDPADLAFAEAMAAHALAARAAATCLDQANDVPPEAMNGRLEHGAPPVHPTRPDPALLLQPAWDSPRGQELAIAFVRSHPAWRLSLQSHKWLGVR